AAVVGEALALLQRADVKPVVQQEVDGGAQAHRCSITQTEKGPASGARVRTQDAVDPALPVHWHCPPPGGDAKRRGGCCATAQRAASQHFKYTGGAHAAADAHGDADALGAAALAFDECMAREALPGHAVGMAHC